MQSVGSFRPNSFPEKSGVVVFTMSEIIKATSNFSPSLKIGQGGFGTVYKGQLNNGSFVAIKRAKKVAQFLTSTLKVSPGSYYIKSSFTC